MLQCYQNAIYYCKLFSLSIFPIYDFISVTSFGDFASEFAGPKNKINKSDIT